MARPTRLGACPVGTPLRPRRVRRCAAGAAALPGLLLALCGRPGAAIETGPGALDRTAVDWWGEREGLPQSWVVSIVQTPDGYLWLSTLEGVVRFDGVRFLAVRRPDTGRPASNRMGAMVLRRDGSLWVASENAGVFRVEGTTLVGVRSTADLRQPTAVREDAAGTLWIVSESALHRLPREGSLEEIARFGEKGPARAGALAVTPDGTVWIAAPGGVFRYGGGTLAPLPKDRAPAGIPLALEVTRDGRLLALTFEGLHRLDGEGFVSLGGRLPFRPLPGARILEDRQGAFWVSAGREGLARLVDGRWDVVPHRKGLAGAQVRSLLEDAEGSLWIGTEGRGLARLRSTSFATIGTAEGLRDPFVWTHLVDREGTLWIGSQDGTLHASAGGTIRAFGTADGLPGAGIRSLGETRDGTLLVGTLGQGVYRRRGTRFEPLPGAEALGRDAIRTMREDAAGSLWIGAESGLYRRRGGRLARVGEGGLRRVVTCLAFDRKGRVWAGTTGEGLFFSEDDGASFRHVGEREGLPDQSIRAFHEDREGGLWVGTEGGGLALVRDGRVAAVVSQANGLFDNTVSVLLDDGRGWLWMSCNRGVSRVRVDELAAVAAGRAQRVAAESFDEADGLVSRECNGSSEPAGLKHPDGTLSFSTMGGVAIVDPARLPQPGAGPPVVVERLVHDGIEAPLHEGVRLPPGRGNLELQFTAPTFLGPERVRFRYRLAPFDDWSEPVARRSAYYTNVPPGTYRFEVIAASRHGRWSERPATVTLELRPSLWQRRSFRLALLGLATLAAALAYRRRVGRLERQRQELATLVSERTRELARANEELERLAATDPGTRLANRRRLEQFLEEEWRRAHRLGLSLGVLVVDVDHFKAYNDRYGHPRGDEVLSRVADVLADVARRAGDLAARYGGEEFVVVLGGADADAVREIAERLRGGVAALRIVHEGSATAPQVTVSVGGAACVPGPSSSPEELVKRADLALYEAKKTRNRVVVAPASPDADAGVSGRPAGSASTPPQDPSTGTGGSTESSGKPSRSR